MLAQRAVRAVRQACPLAPKTRPAPANAAKRSAAEPGPHREAILLASFIHREQNRAGPKPRPLFFFGGDQLSLSPFEDRARIAWRRATKSVL